MSIDQAKQEINRVNPGWLARRQEHGTNTLNQEFLYCYWTWKRDTFHGQENYETGDVIRFPEMEGY